MHALDTLLSKYFSAVSNRFKYRKNACFRYIIFNYFSDVLNRFKYRHNACFRCTLFSSISLQFQIVSDTIRMHALDVHCFQDFLCSSKSFRIPSESCFRDIVFKMFTEVKRFVLNSVRLHALLCFHNCLCSFKISFQIASECTI